ncbi:MAG TPA: ABC transporter substrate-binding protein/permease [Acetobacteraceae bacterium]|nr:ABC transporter substrate-binding protein/permease [Acetobacteraceae bacterium]
MRFLPLLLALLWALPVAAQPRELTFGADAKSNAPYAFADPADTTRLIGFEKEIIDAVATRMGRSARLVQNDWEALIPGLNRGLYDVVMNGLEITPEHEQAVDFSIPYYTTFEQLAVRAGDSYHSLADLEGHKVGTLKASLGERILQDARSVDVVGYDEETDAYSDLAIRRVDAVLLDYPIALYYATPNPALRLVGEPIGRIRYGIAMRKGDAALRQQIDQALKDVMARGELRRILERWNLWTPTMATELDDFTPSATQPVMHQYFLRQTAPASTWRALFQRYVGFLPLLAQAAVVTLEVSVLGMVVAIIVGLCLAIARRYGTRIVATIAVGYIETIRGTPLLIQILFVFYGLPNIGIKLDPFVAGVLALGLNYAAYEAENYRAGLDAIPRGQFEAAVALDLSQAQALRLVIVPQAFRIVIPVMTNDFISLLKDSSLVSVITMAELTRTYEQLSTTYYDYFGTGLLVGTVYLLIGLPFVRLARWTERRLNVDTWVRRPVSSASAAR